MNKEKKKDTIKDNEIKIETVENEDQKAEEKDPVDQQTETTDKDTDKSKKEEKKDPYLELEASLKEKDADEIIKEFVAMKKSLDTTQAEKDELLGKAAELDNRYKRTLADMENLRRRTTQEKQDSLKYANFNIINDLLVILDDFERAIESGKTDKNMDLQHFVDGVQMIEKQFIDLLFKKYGVVKYCEVGEEFDPNIHLAMMAEEGDFETEEITDVFRKGYSLHDRVIRPAQVKIGKPKE